MQSTRDEDTTRGRPVEDGDGSWRFEADLPTWCDNELHSYEGELALTIVIFISPNRLNSYIFVSPVVVIYAEITDDFIDVMPESKSHIVRVSSRLSVFTVQPSPEQDFP